jgi:hypothetical protein
VAIICHQVAIRGHQVAIRGHEAIGPRLWGIRRRSKVHQLQRAARGPRGARYGARARARRTVSELLLAQHGAERAEPFHRREGRIGARRVGDKIPDEGRKQRSSTGPSDAIKTPSRRHQDAIKAPSRRHQGAIKAQSRRNQGAIKAQSRGIAYLARAVRVIEYVSASPESPSAACKRATQTHSEAIRGVISASPESPSAACKRATQTHSEAIRGVIIGNQMGNQWQSEG